MRQGLIGDGAICCQIMAALADRAGGVRMLFRNAPPPDNPKTSAITGMSALHAARSVMQESGLRFV